MNRGQSFLLLRIGSVAPPHFFRHQTVYRVRHRLRDPRVRSLPVPRAALAGLSRGTLQPIPRVACASVGVHAVRALLDRLVDRRVVILPLAYISLGVRPRPHGDRPGNSDIDVEAIETELAALTGEQIEVGEVLTTVGQVLANTLFGGLGGIVTTALRASVGLSLAGAISGLLHPARRAGVRSVAPSDEPRFRRMSRPTSSIGSTR